METLYTPDINSNLGLCMPLANRKTHFFIVILLALAACGSVPPTEVPMPSIAAVKSDSPNRSLIVMLPGMGDRADTFQTTGFLDGGDQWDFDVLAVDAHFGYYRERILIPRLHQDVIVPAIANGYENIWLLGISMGGFGSLLYADQHPENVSGIILLAPFLGEPEIAESIEAEGGLASWSPDDAEGLQDYEIGIWSWLKHASNDSNNARVILGYGRSDRMASSYGPLIDALDPDQVYQIDGGHKWTTWAPLWSQIATDLELSRVHKTVESP